MSDLTIPSALVTAIGIAVPMAFSAVVGFFVKRESELKTDYRNDVELWRERWAREVKLGVQRTMVDTSQGPPRVLPGPTWEENTDLHDARALIEAAEKDRLLKDYIESKRPPAPEEPFKFRPRFRSRPG